jgi:hypothetical protein
MGTDAARRQVSARLMASRSDLVAKGLANRPLQPTSGAAMFG